MRLLKLMNRVVKNTTQAVEELITLVSPATVYRWCREQQTTKNKKNPKAGQRKPREVREFVVEVARTTGFGYTKPYPYYVPWRFA
jgi:transposase